MNLARKICSLGEDSPWYHTIPAHCYESPSVYRGWGEGSALYRLTPPLPVSIQHGWTVQVDYVIVSYTPRACDAGRAETEAFASHEDGTLFHGWASKGDQDVTVALDIDDAELSQASIDGGFHPELALERLGYKLEMKGESACLRN